MLTLNLTWKTIFSSMIRNRSYHNFPSIPEINYIPRNDLPDDDDDHLWTDIYRRQQPVVIRSLVSHWNAVSDPQKRWVDLKCLRDRVVASSDHDQSIVVPVEIGDSYMDENLSKHLIQFPDLLDCYIATTTTKSLHDNIGDHMESSKHSIAMPRIYLAQHDIDEISVLKDDILIPRICNTGKGSIYRKNIWFGSPQGTVSPCHYDPFHNILCQVIGKKEVILFDPSLSSYLYPALHTVQKNTSQVDISRPDLTKYPLYKEILSLVDSDKGCVDESVVSCHSVGRTILYPGDAVYIPFKWWHYCKTSELSCSVNFWWL